MLVVEIGAEFNTKSPEALWEPFKTTLFHSYKGYFNPKQKS